MGGEGGCGPLGGAWTELPAVSACLADPVFLSTTTTNISRERNKCGEFGIEMLEVSGKCGAGGTVPDGE